MLTTCTHCSAAPADDSDLCDVHHAEREAVGEHPAACTCWGCARFFARNTGLFARYWQTRRTRPVLVHLVRRAVFAAADRAELNARADVARDAWIADLEAASALRAA